MQAGSKRGNQSNQVNKSDKEKAGIRRPGNKADVQTGRQGRTG